MRMMIIRNIIIVLLIITTTILTMKNVFFLYHIKYLALGCENPDMM